MLSTLLLPRLRCGLVTTGAQPGTHAQLLKCLATVRSLTTSAPAANNSNPSWVNPNAVPKGESLKKYSEDVTAKVTERQKERRR